MLFSKAFSSFLEIFFLSPREKKSKANKAYKQRKNKKSSEI